MNKIRRGGKRRGSTDEVEKHVRIPHDWIFSAAWRSLRPRAVWAIVMLIDRWQPGGLYTLPVASCSWGCTKATLRSALDEVLVAGFIDLVEKGTQLNHKPDVYRLSDRWKKRSLALTQDADQWKSQKKLTADRSLYVPQWIPVKPKRKMSQRSLKNLRQNKGKRGPRRVVVNEALAKPIPNASIRSQEQSN